MSEFRTNAPQVIANEGLAQGPNVAARAGFEPATLRTKGVESTNEPPRPTSCQRLLHSARLQKALLSSSTRPFLNCLLRTIRTLFHEFYTNTFMDPTNNTYYQHIFLLAVKLILLFVSHYVVYHPTCLLQA